MTAPAVEPVAYSPIGAKVLRVTRLDACGRPTWGQEKSSVTSGGFVQIEYEPEVEEGEDYTQKTANGDLCVAEKGPDSIKWVNVSVEFCAVDPDVVTLMNPTWRAELDADGRTVGFRMTNTLSDTNGFALEAWSRVANTGDVGCEPGDDPDAAPWGYTLLPWTLGNAPDTITYENAAVTFTLKGRTKVNARWGVGPYNVVRDAAGAPAPLAVPLAADEPMLMRLVTVPPPVAAPGAVALPPAPVA